MKRSEFLKKTGLGALSGTILKKGGDELSPDKLIKPAKLKPGDTVAFSAPAGILFDSSDFLRMEKVMDEFGLNIRFGEFVRERYGYFSGTDYQRALDLNRFFVDSSINAIVAVRGGWGCSRILPHLDFDRIRDNPKIFCGFSDLTTLHLAIHKRCGLVTFHGPNGSSDWTELTKKNFKQVLMSDSPARYRSKSRVTTITPGKTSGPLIGGNLSIFTTSLGTFYQPDTTGAILFLEDIGEPVYKIDRMMAHLKTAGLLDNLSGFIFGRCTNCPAAARPGFTLRQILDQYIKPLGIPAIMGADIGHDPDNFTLPIGLQVTLHAGKGEFWLEESAVV